MSKLHSFFHEKRFHPHLYILEIWHHAWFYFICPPHYCLICKIILFLRNFSWFLILFLLPLTTKFISTQRYNKNTNWAYMYIFFWAAEGFIKWFLFLEAQFHMFLCDKHMEILQVFTKVSWFHRQKNYCPLPQNASRRFRNWDGI